MHRTTLRPASIGGMAVDVAVACWEDFLSEADVGALLPEVLKLTDLTGGQHTFFIADDEEPSCALESYAQAIAMFHHARTGSPSQSYGAEWWVHVIAPDEPLSIHWDCDHILMSDTGEHVSPTLATVTYLSSHGAPTVTFPVVADAKGQAQPEYGGGTGLSAYASFPLTGKHFVFDGKLLHGVPYDGPSHEVEGSDAKHRITFLCNMWVGARPRRIHRLPSDMVASVTTPDGSEKPAPNSPAGLGLPAPTRLGSLAVLIPPQLVPSPQPLSGEEWRHFRIGSFCHSPVSLRPLHDLWSRPFASSSSEAVQGDPPQGEPVLAHFLRYAPVELKAAG